MKTIKLGSWFDLEFNSRKVYLKLFNLILWVSFHDREVILQAAQ